MTTMPPAAARSGRIYDPRDVHALARVNSGLPLDDDQRAGLSRTFRGMIEHLETIDAPEDRAAAYRAMLAARDDGDDLADAVDAVDPNGPAPEPEADDGPRIETATLADLRRVLASTDWIWPGWIVGGALNALAAEPGTGKTIMAMDLARRLHHGEPWPDGADNPHPAGGRTLWVAGDRHHAQLLDLAAAYGLPDEALLLNTAPDDPAGGLDLDDPETRAALESRIQAEGPALIIVDTVGATTGLDLCRSENARTYYGPLADMAIRTGVPFLVLTHTNKDGEALGRRIVGAVRSLWKMTEPDPEGQADRRRVWVDKSYITKPAALGMTITATGCTFDHNPPAAPEPARPGRPPEAREKAERFIRDALASDNDQTGNDLAARWTADGESRKTFWRAVDALEASGDLVKDGGTGTGRQVVLHLNSDGAPVGTESPPL